MRNPTGRSLWFWCVPAVMLLLLGTVLYTDVLGPVLMTGRAAYLKLTGRGTVCTWARISEIYATTVQFSEIRNELRKTITVIAKEDGGLMQISSPFGPFWIRDESIGSGTEYLFAEHHWTQNTNQEALVRNDDVVIDVGAHVGVFVATALSRGARLVVAIEPDPRNVECLRRNFSAEISAGRVRIVPEGAWSSEGMLQLHLGSSTAWNSLVRGQNGGTIDVPVRPLDDIVEELKLERVNYIKMDIEGAEREALKGSMRILKRDHPTVMLDSHQLADDMELLPQIVLGVDPGYRLICGACQFEHKLLVPHVTFYVYGE